MKKKWKIKTLSLLVGSASCLVSPVHAAGKIEWGDTKWISVGAGVRSSFASIEDAAPNGDDHSRDFNLDNARIYINGQIHENVKIEFNTECVFCSNDDLRDYDVLDAIGKFEFNKYFNIWAGRLLVPADRAEMSGPFYANTYDFNKTPFYPADFSVEFGNGGAGVFGRDHGLTVWGAAGPEDKFQYAVGVFDGLRSDGGSGPNRDDSFLYGARIAYNFMAREQNPGYYTSSTYYGNASDILTLGYAVQYQEDGAGSFANPGDFLGMSVDLLWETVLDRGVVTVEGEYKTFDSDFSTAAFADTDCFCMFDGDAWTVTGLYLMSDKVGIGQFQPYIRFTAVSPDESSDRDEVELGLNYIINGHNARISAFYQHGDIATKGLDYSPTATGDEVGAFKIALQLQI
ncbi:MAG: hypothetical protein U5S82_02675 [Gammaproteobacteria bacterium]|nr:hypothetical protein [Gammaproteobacteria bacterium]